MRPLLKGEKAEWDNTLFARYSMWDWNQNGAKLRAFRTPEWKLDRDFKHEGKDELHNLKQDPAEATNLIRLTDPAVQQVRAWLNERLLERLRSIDDP